MIAGAPAPSIIPDAAIDRSAPRPGFGEALRVWARIGCLSFGGPAGQIALMHREIVEQRGWLGESEYLNALNFCMLLPGPEAMQLATYAGWRLHGLRGGLAAGLLFVLPGALLVLGLAVAYAALGDVPLVEAAFVGIKAAVLVIVLEALLRISRRALHDRRHYLIAATAFVAIFLFAVPFPLIVLGAALAGFALLGRSATAATARSPVPLARTLVTILAWLGIWLLPLALLWAWLGHGHVLVQLGLFFSKLAVVTFGGAYAVLAYMAQAAVESHGWLSAGEMLDGLGLAETTPGPLILVTEFVGYLAAARSSGEPSVLLGSAGAAVTLWATFAPCFLWIFAGAPYVVRIGQSPGLRAALQGITAAVVGVILNLSIWFGLNVLAPGIEERWAGPLRYWLPPPSGLDPVAVALTVVAALALFRLKLGVPATLGLCAGLALLWAVAP
ncbi:MAG TPA: chromate efflux transporter [Geminicoccaceae bacterium]